MPAQNLLVLGLDHQLLAAVKLGDEGLALDDLELLLAMSDQALDLCWVLLALGGMECIPGAAHGIVAEVVGREFGRVVEQRAVERQDLRAGCRGCHYEKLME